MDEPVLGDELMRDRARMFEEFLNDFPDHDYAEDIKEMLTAERTRLLINLNDVRQYRRSFADGCVF
jgi:DNA replication licensing factor MCM3